MPAFSSLSAANRYHSAARLRALRLTVRNAACPSSSAVGGSSALNSPALLVMYLAHGSSKIRTAPAACTSQRSPSRTLPRKSRESIPMSQRTAYISARICASAGLSPARGDRAMTALEACNGNTGEGDSNRGSTSLIDEVLVNRTHVGKTLTEPPLLSFRNVSHTVIASL